MKAKALHITLLFLFLLLLNCAAAGAEEPIPIEIGLGPSFNRFQNVNYSVIGLKLSICALIDRQYIQSHKDKIPGRYQNLANSLEQVRVSPSIFIPDTVYLPTNSAFKTYGATWRPIGLDLFLIRRPVQLSVGVGVVVSYIIFFSQSSGTTNFLRPGVAPGVDLHIPLIGRVSASMGLNTSFYIPQRLDGTVFSTGSRGQRIWNIQQGYVMLHIGFDYRR